MILSDIPLSCSISVLYFINGVHGTVCNSTLQLPFMGFSRPELLNHNHYTTFVPNSYTVLQTHHSVATLSLTLASLTNSAKLSLAPTLHTVHACKVAEKMPQREPTHVKNFEKFITTHRRTSSYFSPSRSMEKRVRKEFSSRDSSRLVFDEKMVEKRTRKEIAERDNSGCTSSKLRNVGLAEKRGNHSEEGEGKVVKRSKKLKVKSPEIELRVKLDMCSKAGDVMGAISLYDSAVRDSVKLEQYHYNVLLYLCSSAAIGVVYPAKSGNNPSSSISTLSVDSEVMDDMPEVSHDKKVQSKIDVCIENGEGEINGSSERTNQDAPMAFSEEVQSYARKRGYEIYEKMCLENVPMSEAALTSVARMAMSMGNGDMAFEIVKRMDALGLTPRLRSYGPALFTFCQNGDVQKAFEVEAHMIDHGVFPEEPELEALLKVSMQACRSDKVYYVLHKLRTSVRQVTPAVACLIEEWFASAPATRVGKRKWDEKAVEEAMENGGGGWHGLGWLGRGKWNVQRTQVDAHGSCICCGQKLATIDLDSTETENFAKSVATIACKREKHSSFQTFQKWLDYYGPFEAIVDAANVGLFSQRQFSISKVNAVVNAMRQKLPSKKWPLIIVHNRRLFKVKINDQKIIEKWKNADAIYATPTGSNDDWYWLYAAIKFRALIITNDEMRDHIFQVLGNDFFPKWKERHQVHFSYRNGTFEFLMPPPCSVVIQESRRGDWHIPIYSEQDLGTQRTWLCVTRSKGTAESSKPPRDSRCKNNMENYSSCASTRNQKQIQCDGNRQHHKLLPQFSQGRTREKTLQVELLEGFLGLGQCLVTLKLLRSFPGASLIFRSNSQHGSFTGVL